MSVLIALSVRTGYLFSVAQPFLFTSESLLRGLVFRHWDGDARHRQPPSDAIRALLDLAPPKATVIPKWPKFEVPTSGVQIDDMVLIRPQRRPGQGRRRHRRPHESMIARERAGQEAARNERSCGRR